MSWTPLLEGALAVEARTAVLDIARAIAAGEGEPAGVTDRALFWAYVAGAFDDAWIADAYDAAVGELIEAAPQRLARLSLYGGAAGLGFTIAHVSEPGSADASLAAIDEMIGDALAVQPWTGDYDLISGLAGIGVYLLERGDAPTAQAALARTIDQLVATSVPDGPGRAWLTPAALVSPHQRTRFPDGAYNGGVAHGTPGVIAFLARAGAAGHPRASELAREAMRWLAAQYIADDPYGHFPPWIDRDRRGPSGGTRSAWCYGDAGVALATFGAARRLDEPTDGALALAREQVARPFERALISDAGLCHGASGLAHMFNRLYQATGDVAIRDGARAWFGHALAMRGNPEGVAGFAANLAAVREPPRWAANASLLEGAIGIALALLAAIRTDEPGWDRTLLCDL